MEAGYCASGWENLCLDEIDGYWWGVAIELVTLVFAFVGVAIVADQHLVVALETLCVRWDVREDVAGASFMAFGSAAPEIVINAISTLKSVISSVDHEHGVIKQSEGGDDAALGVGAIIGSGMIAFTVIPGLCGIFAGGEEPLELKRRPLARDVITYGCSLAWLSFVFSDGVIETQESLVMLLGYGVYLLVVIFSSRIREAYRVQWLKKDVRLGESFVLSSRVASSTPTSSGANTRASSHGDLEEDGTYDPPSPPSYHSDKPYASDVEGTTLSRVHFDGRVDTNSTLYSMSQTSNGPHSTSAETVSQDHKAARVSFLQTLSEPPSSTQRMLALRDAVCSTAEASVAPLEWLIGLTCPECYHDGEHAQWYPITLFSAFLWVAVLSLIISAVVSRFGTLLNVPAAFLGMYIIAIGAEIPDTIQSITVAKRGYGSMAVSNSCGSQIINILVGLGLPWFLSNSAGIPIDIQEHQDLKLMAVFQSGIMMFFAAVMLVSTAHTWRPGDHRKAVLGKGKGTALLAAYIACIAGYPIIHNFCTREYWPDRAGEMP